MRSIKTEREVKALRVSTQVSAVAHSFVMKNVQQNIFENQVHSLFSFLCQNCGLRNQSYEPIVGTGRNSAILHYTKNNMQLRDGQLLLIDAGGEYLGYTSDITRTYPVNGRFSDMQKRIYEAVLNVQINSSNLLRVNALWDDILRNSQLFLLQELVRLGLIRGTILVMHNARVHTLFMPHGLGHHIGLDVHDTTKLVVGPVKENMVVTIEPGIYFIPFLFERATEEQKRFLVMSEIQKYFNFGGIRIEDDYLVVRTGNPQCLSCAAPKTVYDIERNMRP